MRHPDVTPVPPAVQSVPKQEPGIRRARPLPYELDAVATVGTDGLTITFANHGAAGAVFHSPSTAPAREPDPVASGPYLTPRDLHPQPKARRNEPAFLPHIARAVAAALGRPLEDLALETTRNAKVFFGLS